MSVLSVLADILFVGHSLVSPNLPPLVEGALARMEAPARVEAQIINGAPLSWNRAHAASAEGVDGTAALASGRIGALVLTEAIPLAPNVEFNDTAGEIAEWARIARAGRPEVRVYLYETWHSLASGPGTVIEGDAGAATPWRARIEADAALWARLAREGAAAAGVEVGVIPAGQAMGRAADAIAAGEVPGLDSIRDLFADDIHPNGKGFYLVAMVHAAVLTGRSPEGLPARLTRSWPNRDAVLTEEQAAALQRIAWETVQDWPARAAALAAAAPQPAPQPAPPPAAPAPAEAVEVAGAPAPAPPPLPAYPPVTTPNLFLNLSSVNDWATQLPFLDLMKTARPWTGHLPGQWGGWGHDDLQRAGALDPQGWPRRIPPELTGLSTLVLTDLPPDTAGVAGRYLVRWQGRGRLEIGGRAQGVTMGAGEARFDVTPGEGGVVLTIVETDPADPLRAITIHREDRVALAAGGAIFNPDWLARLRGVAGLRLMGWMAANDSPLSRAADRPRVEDYTWARIGVPAEILVALANELQADPWFTLPHAAEDALVEEYARIAHAGLAPGRRAWVELSNEVWNWQFAQAAWAEAQARARWGQEGAWVEFYALRAAEVAGIWARVFADDPGRLVRVIATQTGHKGLETRILEAPLVMAEGRPAPAEAFDAYAVTGYVSGLLGAPHRAGLVRGWLEESAAADPGAPLALAFDRAAEELRTGALSGRPEDTLEVVLNDLFPHHAAVAARHGLSLVMYEGGTHVVGMDEVREEADLTAFFTAFNYSDQMGAIYRDLMAGWARVSDQPFNAFADVAPASKWGSWGSLRHLGDDSPRWQAIAQGCPGC
jgi:hypothetical protein